MSEIERYFWFTSSFIYWLFNLASLILLVVIDFSKTEFGNGSFNSSILVELLEVLIIGAVMATVWTIGISLIVFFLIAKSLSFRIPRTFKFFMKALGYSAIPIAYFIAVPVYPIVVLYDVYFSIAAYSIAVITICELVIRHGRKYY